jgi:hypothetical protein
MPWLWRSAIDVVSALPSASLSGAAGHCVVADGHEPHGGLPLAVSLGA